ncbi:PD-(D/E)XK nuclease domain-containing protein, partial [Candidatus Methanomethylophilus sp. 1R26]|uniref:PD-(D/E)XK nuclease domain-containing protein n=1 Tax=Candidatus Methanomethylophilus sp. 1R26 TaxID=1769296 RepID=UPI001F1AF67E
AGMLMSLGDTFRVEADRESGDGYSDIRIISSSPEHPSVIIEIKRAKDGADAESLAQSALEQIRAKRYCAGLKGEVLAYGAAFAGKDVSIASETVAPENRSPEA